ncbi:uncharacterized protein LOC131675893 [Topomyia yanbarensis]|uniref:uncharacterized protein LOC131675893 n=1 Tax=Topomyia yanbarensis TaxID=2498891 RepID=UPI00273C4984|nr:uncharacterized protein LOC131675893 [Topomyia yanbarensis]
MEDFSTNNHCMYCQDPDDVDDMVQCDICQMWAHFRCAGVSDDIKDSPWSCAKCCNQLRIPKQSKKTAKRAGARSEGGSVRSAVSALDASLRQLEEEQLLQERPFSEDRVLRMKRLEMERVLKEKRLQQEKELLDKEQQQERELQNRLLEQEREMLGKRLADEVAFQKRRQALRQQFQEQMESLKEFADDDGAVGGDAFEERSQAKGLSSKKKVQNWLFEQDRTHGKQEDTMVDPRGAYPKESRGQVIERKPTSTLSIEGRTVEEREETANQETEDEDENHFSKGELERFVNLIKGLRRNGSGHEPVRSTKARQTESKLLPTVEGEPGRYERKIQNWLFDHGKSQENQEDAMVGTQGVVPKGSRKQIGSKKHTSTLSKMGRLMEELEEIANQETEEVEENDSDFSREELERVANLLKNRRRNGSGHELVGPTNAQRAARQAVSKHLPIFKGEPEVWPIFISSLEYTTKACGFTNLDNLKRLQDSLQGDALEAVRSRLIFPDSVPDVIKDLRDLFGKPEKLLKSLLVKVRRAQPPRVDQLNSFIHFGITVKQLCDHLEAAKMTDHLNNTMLVQEIVDKLPPTYKLEWVRFKRSKIGTPLRVFTDFMTGIVSDVSEVSEFSIVDSEDPPRFSKMRPKKEFMHVHTSTSNGRELSPDRKSKLLCWLCRGAEHKIRFCEEFKQLSVSERFKVAERFGLCVLCLNNHGKNRCNFKLRCNVMNCQGNHHPLLHRASNTVPVVEAKCNTHSRSSRSVIFRMVPVTIHAGSTMLDALAFLDEGSSVTLIEDDIVTQLKISGEAEPLVVTWTGNVKRYENQSKKVNLTVSARDAAEKLPLLNVRTVTQLDLPKQRIKFQEIAEHYPHLRDIPVKDYTLEEPKLMIGLDNVHLFAPIESRIGQPGDPIGVKSLLGWTVYEPVKQQPSMQDAYMNLHDVIPVTNQDLHDILRNQFVLEEAGISAVVPESVEDERARAILKATTIRVDGRFETGLIWRADQRRFPNSYPMAERRMKALERKLERDPELHRRVNQQIQDYETKGYAHKITAKELSETDPASVWYLPLNVVLNPRKPGKLRLVWDAAASVNGVSLNSELLKGPDMLTCLPGVIQRFRERRFGFGGDIKEMYHQLRIRVKDKQAQRFLYRFDSAQPVQIYVMDVATFGSTCSPCSAQFVKNLNAENFEKRYPDAAAAIIEKHYVDDYFDSVDTVEEAIKRASEVRLIHLQGGFEIRNWVSNSKEFLQAMGEQCCNHSIHFHQDKETEMERVLGIVWDPNRDVLSFSTTPRVDFQSMLFGAERPTKRAVLSCVMAMFDPLGFLSPFTIIGRILVQDLWRTGCGWDELIDDLSFEKWTKWTKMLPEIAKIQVPRSYFGEARSDQYENLQLHVFTDASENAYGCVAYFRIEIDGEVCCALVMSRSKVAPLKQLTIPRLELQAAVLGARLAESIRRNHSLKINQQFIWTDSRNVLSWIKSDQRRYRQYVGFRIGDILSHTSVSDWRWVPTLNNEADRVTKWKRGASLHSNSSWFKGADILFRKEMEWPEQPVIPANINEELKAHLLVHDVTLSCALLDISRISKWRILVRTMACVYRFVSNCRRKIEGRPIETLKATKSQAKYLKKVDWMMERKPLKQEEYEKAEYYLFKAAQSEVYEDELKVLLHNREHPVDRWLTVETSSPLYKLAPLVDNKGMVRMEGRTKNAEFLPFDLRFPIILQKEHPLTAKLVQHYREKFGHGYRETVKNELKQRFYVHGIGGVVQKVAKACVWCRVNRSRPHTPRMAPLPIQRLIPYQRPFSYVGVDYLGPFEVVVGRRKEKRWIVLFTCLVIRAIHLEVACSLTTQACLMAIRRFVCRRGPPLEFISDNGTNFRVASRELEEMVRNINEEYANEFTSARVKWSFNPPAAPHMGGVWERLVRSVKEALEVMDDGRKLTDEILLTSMNEAEDMINSRPLTYVSLANDAEMLTPNHFLRGVSPNEPQLTPPPPHSAEALRNAYQRSQQLATQLWNRWIKEYLPTLNQRTKWFNETKQLEVGDLVYVVEGDKRKQWVRGVVEELIGSSDGRIRQAWIRTRSGT